MIGQQPALARERTPILAALLVPAAAGGLLVVRQSAMMGSTMSGWAAGMSTPLFLFDVGGDDGNHDVAGRIALTARGTTQPVQREYVRQAARVIRAVGDGVNAVVDARLRERAQRNP